MEWVCQEKKGKIHSTFSVGPAILCFDTRVSLIAGREMDLCVAFFCRKTNISHDCPGQSSSNPKTEHGNSKNKQKTIRRHSASEFETNVMPLTMSPSMALNTNGYLVSTPKS